MLDHILGIVGIAATIWAAYDARHQRSLREKAVVAATNVIARSEGLLIGLKPAVVASSPGAVKAIDDGLDAIKVQRVTIEGL